MNRSDTLTPFLLCKIMLHFKSGNALTTQLDRLGKSLEIKITVLTCIFCTTDML